MKHKYVILGGGVAAGYAAQEFARHDNVGDLAIISADDTEPYERPPLSKDYLQGDSNIPDILINDEGFYRDNDITLYLKTRVERIDTAERVLYTDAGDDIEFEKLMIATGSKVNTLDIPGADLEGVEYLRLLDDSIDIRSQSDDVRHVVILGGGYIGMEVASVMRQAGADVTMVFPSERLMESRFFTPEMSAMFRTYYEAQGIKFIIRQKAERIVGKDGRVTHVQFDPDDRIPADMVVAGIGVSPADTLFEGTDLNADDGLLTNEYLETNIDGIYAAGDIAKYLDMNYGKQRRLGHWDNAKNQGQYVMRRMLGKDDGAYRHTPYFFSDVFDLSYEFWGDATDYDDIVYRGEIDAEGFSVWWLKNDYLMAAFIMGRPDEERQFAQHWMLEPVGRERLLHPEALIPEEATT